MPYRIRKRSSGYAIVKVMRGGRTRTVGRSSTKAKAQASVRARLAGEHGWKPSRRRRRRK